MSKWALIDSSLEGRQRVFFPHFANGCVPLDPEQNRLWRQNAFAVSSRAEQKHLRKMCKDDLLFYVAGFVSIFDAGDESGKPGPIPFLPYDFQIECFTILWNAMHEKRGPVRGKKPRRLGFTWMVMALIEHCWHFSKNRHLLVGSQREEEVDGTAAIAKGDMFTGEWSKLLPKIDFMHLFQPRWLLPDGYKPRVEPYRTRMKVMNPETGSIVWGTSATGKAGRSGRGYAAFWDEAAHTENLGDIIGSLSKFAACKIWVSSIGNLDHAFSTILKDAPGVTQIPLEWWMHPDYSRDLRIDPETGERTSPWLAKSLDEINHDPLIANREIFADESKQIGGFYHPDTFAKMLGTSDRPGTVCPPWHRGMLDVVDTPEGPRVTRFVEQPTGQWRFWLEFGKDGRPPHSTKYIIGCDIAAGTTDSDGRGASNSVLAVADWLTGELVAEYVTHGKRPEVLARMAYAASLWFEGEDFQGARIVPERNGPGGQFVDVLTKHYGYRNVWKDVDEEFGWHKGGGQKPRSAFGLHQQMICENRFKERSKECADEMKHYQNVATGKAPVHSAALHSEDPSGARENHGDRTIARVMLCQLLQNEYETTIDSAEAAWGSARSIKERERQRAYEAELA